MRRLPTRSWRRSFTRRALARRAAGYPPETREGGSVADPYVDKIDEWIEGSSVRLSDATSGKGVVRPWEAKETIRSRAFYVAARKEIS